MSEAPQSAPQNSEGDPSWAREICETCFKALTDSHVQELSRNREDLMTWRRGSSQLVLKVNPGLNNFTIYSVLASGVEPSMALYRYLFTYNILQRRETLGLFENNGEWYVVMKYTMELELAQPVVLQRHIFALQEVADQLDSELVNHFGGSIHYKEWDKLDQSAVDNLLDDLFD